MGLGPGEVPRSRFGLDEDVSVDVVLEAVVGVSTGEVMEGAGTPEDFVEAASWMDIGVSVAVHGCVCVCVCVCARQVPYTYVITYRCLYVHVSTCQVILIYSHLLELIQKLTARSA